MEDPDIHMHAARGRRLLEVQEHVKVTGESVHYDHGAWLYGDYRSAAGVSDPVGCAQACDADEECFHWNFNVLMHKCDLKTDHGGLDEEEEEEARRLAAREL